MPTGLLHEKAPDGKYGSIQMFDWKYLSGECDQVHSRLWGTMTLETFVTLDRREGYFDYRFTDGDKKSLSVRVEPEYIRIDFKDKSLRRDGCTELYSGSIELPLKLEDLNGKLTVSNMHNGVTSDKPFYIAPWNRSFIMMNTNQEFQKLFKE